MTGVSTVLSVLAATDEPYPDPDTQAAEALMSLCGILCIAGVIAFVVWLMSKMTAKHYDCNRCKDTGRMPLWKETGRSTSSHMTYPPCICSRGQEIRRREGYR